MKIFKIILITCFIGACTNVGSIDKDSKLIDIDIAKSLRFLDAEKLLDTIGHEIIALETTNDNLIGSIDKLFVVEDKIYILDQDNRTVFIYDLNGKYLSKISSQGRAKNEYIEITDFYVNHKRLYILDNYSMRLLVYDVLGKYIKTLDISTYWGNGLFAINNTIYLLNQTSNTKNGKFNIFKIDDNGNLQDKYLKFNRNFRYTPDLNVYTESNNIFNVCICPNAIHQVDSGICRLAYKINFVDKNLPERYRDVDLRVLLQEGVANKYVMGIDKIQESSNKLFLYFQHRNDCYTVIYNKKNDYLTVCGGVLVSSMYRMGFSNYFIQNDYVYDIIEANYFKIRVPEIIEKHADVKDKYLMELEDLNQRISEYSNPIIIKYKLKE